MSDKFLLNNNPSGEGTDNLFTLSFDYRFEHPGDEVWFAHAVPYTFTTMQRLIKRKLTDHRESIMRAEILCNSLGGMPVPLITITDDVKSYLSYSE